MTSSDLTILSGALSIDQNGERLFLSTRSDTHARFGSRVLDGNHVLRVINDARAEVFPTIFSNQSQAVSLAGRLATEDERRQHDDSGEFIVVAERVIPQDEIRQRAFHLFQSGGGRSAVEDWLIAERELLDIGSSTGEH